MKLTQQTLNHVQNPHQNKILSNSKIQTKKKTYFIKLEVHRLLKPQLNKITSNINNKSLYVSSHHKSQEESNQSKSVQKQPEIKQQQKINKTFQQLYFEKIKQLKLQQNNILYSKSSHSPQKNLVGSQKVRLNSCKNSVSIKNKNKLTTEQHQSIKHSNDVGNKENINIQKLSEDSSISMDNNFFEKFNPAHNILRLSHQVDIDLLETQKTKCDQQKIKRVLKLKKANPKAKLTYNLCYQKDEVSKKFQTGQQNSMAQKSLSSPINKMSNTSQQLKTFKLSTPLSSTGSKLQLSSSISLLFQEITESRLDHSQHQHIWGGVQCFFSFAQFEIIINSFGFNEKFNHEIGFYVHKMWQHLGGDLYGGVVKKNMMQFLNIVFQDQLNQNEGIHEVYNLKNETPLKNNFIQKSSLKLTQLSFGDKDEIKKFYFPIRMRKIESTLQNQRNQHLKLQNPRNSPNPFQELQTAMTLRKFQLNILQAKDTPDQKSLQSNQSLHLQNNAYLDTISVKNRQQQMSPCMIQNTDTLSSLTLVTDFSPKLSTQQCEPFKSTVLQKQPSFCQKLSTQLTSQIQYHQVKSYLKPLLSVDVNLGEGILQKIVVYQDQDPYEVSLQLKKRYNIDEELRHKFQIMLKNHLKHLLFKIEEVSEELFQDSVELKDQQFRKDFILMERQY